MVLIGSRFNAIQAALPPAAPTMCGRYWDHARSDQRYYHDCRNPLWRRPCAYFNHPMAVGHQTNDTAAQSIKQVNISNPRFLDCVHMPLGLLRWLHH